MKKQPIVVRLKDGDLPARTGDRERDRAAWRECKRVARAAAGLSEVKEEDAERT